MSKRMKARNTLIYSIDKENYSQEHHYLMSERIKYFTFILYANRNLKQGPPYLMAKRMIARNFLFGVKENESEKHTFWMSKRMIARTIPIQCQRE